MNKIIKSYYFSIGKSFGLGCSSDVKYALRNVICTHLIFAFDRAILSELDNLFLESDMQCVAVSASLDSAYGSL